MINLEKVNEVLNKNNLNSITFSLEEGFKQRMNITIVKDNRHVFNIVNIRDIKESLDKELIFEIALSKMINQINEMM